MATLYEESISLVDRKSGFNSATGIYHSNLHLSEDDKIPTEPKLDTTTYVLSHFPSLDQAETQIALIDSTSNEQVTYARLHRSVKALATGLYHGLGVRKGDVVFVLSPNSVLYPTICLAVLSIGAVLTTANPVNTAAEIAKQVRDSRAKLGIASPDEMKKLVPTGLPSLVTSYSKEYENELTVQELVDKCEPSDIPQANIVQSDTAAILYSSGTTGTSKGVVLTHSNVIAIMKLLKWSVEVSNAKDDVFLCFIPMFHIYGLAFFALGMFCSGNTTVIMQRFDFKDMLEAIQTYKINNIPAVPPVILGLLKYPGGVGGAFSSLRRVGSGAAPLSKEVADGFRHKFPWVELRPGYGLTESCGGATFFPSGDQAKFRPASSGPLVPCFSAKVVDVETGKPLPPFKQGELWLKSPTIMKEYLGNDEATAATFDSDGWLKTGDLCYIDGDGYLYIVDRIKELIKHNGYQVAPAELEAILLSHPHILDAAVIPVEDEKAGQIPMAYVVKASSSDLTEDRVIKFVAEQVAPYKKIRMVKFISAIPRSAAGKILRRQLAEINQGMISKL